MKILSTICSAAIMSVAFLSNMAQAQEMEGDVFILTDANFEEIVYGSEDIWMVEIYAPWCGHCKKLTPHWAAAATNLKGKVNFGKVDATVHTALKTRFEIKGFPTLFHWGHGVDQKKDGLQVKYASKRDTEGLTAFASDLHSKAFPDAAATEEVPAAGQEEL